MKQILIIPDKDKLKECSELVRKYGLGYEYNDFFMPDVLDDYSKTEALVSMYKNQDLPLYTTVHGAFFDVVPFSVDSRIRGISKLRVEQSVDVAKMIGAKAVVFHTNYNPFLRSRDYVKTWIDTNTMFWKEMLEKNPMINIYLENTFEFNPDILEELSKNLSDYNNYGVCFDYAHAALSQTSVEEWSKRLGRFIKHVHINDNDGISDLHLAWGNGKLDRFKFYECYEKYMNGASVLIETSKLENIIYSLEKLEQEGFLK